MLLCCLGLDTIATVELNGQVVGKADNMHRTWEWDAAPFLKEGENTITVTFDSAVKYALKANERELPLHWDGPGENGQACGVNAGPFQMIRKEACNFGWDWGTHAVTCGIWKNIQHNPKIGITIGGLGLIGSITGFLGLSFQERFALLGGITNGSYRFQLRLFGAEIFIANLVGLGMAREMGAMMTAIIMAGRTGAAYAALLGSE